MSSTGHELRGRRELWLFVAAYLVYTASRWVFAGEMGPATDNAEWIIGLERDTGLDVERTVQQSFDSDAVMWLMSNVYLAAQLVVLPGSLLLLYRRAPSVYKGLRDTVLATWMLSVPVFALFPVAPPRLAGIGLEDTVSGQAGVALTGNSTMFYNPLAAVPSLHCGFAVAIGIALAVAARRRWSTAVALMWGPLVCLTVVTTGNHYIFDIAAGLLVAAAGYLGGRQLSARLEQRSRAARPARGRMALQPQAA
jgi:membrane-associated phospholipid phosphatase